MIDRPFSQCRLHPVKHVAGTPILSLPVPSSYLWCCLDTQLVCWCKEGRKFSCLHGAKPCSLLEYIQPDTGQQKVFYLFSGVQIIKKDNISAGLFLVAHSGTCYLGRLAFPQPAGALMNYVAGFNNALITLETKRAVRASLR